MHQGACKGFCIMKQLGSIATVLLLEGVLVHRRLPLPRAFRQVSLTVCWYPFILLGGGRCVRVKCLAQQHNTMTRPGLELEPFDPESRALTIRPPSLSEMIFQLKFKQQQYIEDQNLSSHPSFPLSPLPPAV